MIVRKKQGYSSKISTAFLFFVVPLHAYGEISTDGSLGTPPVSINGPDYSIATSLGQLSGNNLFHSFSVFNVNTGETAEFTGPANVANIFSRVTAGGATLIDGGLGSTIEGANLYFINPNGIVFGDNASLNLSGSFYASTAEYITLEDGARFDVTQSSDVTLSSSPVSAFGFLDSNIADIQINQSNLQVTEGATLAFIGGDINVQGSGKLDSDDFKIVKNAELAATNGRIELIALASSGEVNLQNNNPVLDNVSEQADVTLSNGAELTTRGNPGGKIFIRAGRLVIEDSTIDASNSGDKDYQSQSSAIDISLSGDILMSEGKLNQGATIQAFSYSSGNSGDIDINSDQLLIKSAKGTLNKIKTMSLAAGNSGDININTNNLALSSARITTENKADGQSGQLNITAKTIDLVAQESSTTILSTNLGQGVSGNINITADQFTAAGSNTPVEVGVISSASIGNTPANIRLNIKEMKLLNGGQVSVTKAFLADDKVIALSDPIDPKVNSLGFSDATLNGSNGVGDIDITSESILISGQLSGINLPPQQAQQGEDSITGNVTIKTKTLVVDQFGIIRSRVNASSTADSGDINIDANSLEIRNAGTISSSAFQFGRSGLVNINTDTLEIVGSDILSDTLFESQSGIYSSSTDLSTGAKDININASKYINVRNGGVISAATFGVGDGGDINLNAPEINITGRNITTKTVSTINTGSVGTGSDNTLDGNGGDINLTGNEIKISDNALITAQNSKGATGNAGNINIIADNILLDKQSVISATSTSSGDAGNIIVQAADTLNIDHSIVKTKTQQSDGGNITLNAVKLISLENSDISTSAEGGTGSGGNISIDPELLFINKSRISANAFKGQGGNISIQANNMIISPDSKISASSQLGFDGKLIINTNNDDVGSQLEKASAVTSEGSAKFKQNCSARKGLYSSFVVDKLSDSIFEQTGLIFSDFLIVDKIADSSRQCASHKTTI